MMQCLLCNLGILPASQNGGIYLSAELKTCPSYILEEHYAYSNQ